MSDAPMDPSPSGGNSALLFLTSPILKFLVDRQQADQANTHQSQEDKKIVFWPFAVAGGVLFGLGIYGGHAFMSGKINSSAAESEAPVASHKKLNFQSKLAEKPISPENRRLALRTASAALGLGTLLACSGAFVCVKLTYWYLGINNAQDFAAYMRSRLPSQLGQVTSYTKIVEKKESLTTWFREELGMGKYLDDKECQRRVNEAKAIHKKGLITERELEIEISKIMLKQDA
uniref:Transmembrane protein 242 n=1 Tax=Guillardia theta TaxID=55529 RepID=A0A7S4K255_GUITH